MRKVAAHLGPQYTPQSEFYSERSGVRLQLTDNYVVRNDMLATLLRNAESWLASATQRAPIEVQGILQVRWLLLIPCDAHRLGPVMQKYLAQHEAVVLPDSVELGASIALKYAVATGSSDRKIGTV